MASLDDIRNGLATNLVDTFDGIVNVSAYMLPQPIAPVLEIYPDKFLYDELIGTDEIHMKVRAIVGNVLEIGGQKLLDNLLDTSGDQSVKAALESDSTLGELVDDLRVESCTGYRMYPVEGQPGQHWLGCEWTVVIHATRS